LAAVIGVGSTPLALAPTCIHPVRLGVGGRKARKGWRGRFRHTHREANRWHSGFCRHNRYAQPLAGGA